AFAHLWEYVSIASPGCPCRGRGFFKPEQKREPSMPPKIVIILGHPDRKSFGGALADAYARSARENGCEVSELHIASMQFDAAPSSRPPAQLEDDLAASRAAIAEARHIVLVYPTWMGAMPARMKGFFER